MQGHVSCILGHAGTNRDKWTFNIGIVADKNNKKSYYDNEIDSDGWVGTRNKKDKEN